MLHTPPSRTVRHRCLLSRNYSFCAVLSVAQTDWDWQQPTNMSLLPVLGAEQLQEAELSVSQAPWREQAPGLDWKAYAEHAKAQMARMTVAGTCPRRPGNPVSFQAPELSCKYFSTLNPGWYLLPWKWKSLDIYYKKSVIFCHQFCLTNLKA